MLESLIGSIIEALVGNFDFSFCVAVNILTYMIVKIFDTNKKKRLTAWHKRIVLLCSIAVLSAIYYCEGTTIKIIVNSAILAPVSWSWLFKPICKKLNLDYKKLDVI